MEITILGSGTSIPHPKRASPGFVIRFDRTTVLVDPSSGSLHRAERYGIRVKEIDCVVCTHFHLDHTADLPPLFFALKNETYFAGKKITLAGPPGMEDLYRALIEIYGSSVRLPKDRLSIQEIYDDQLKFRDGGLRSLPVLHTEQSIGCRFTDSSGKVFMYSGDSDYCETLVDLARDADAALIESSQPSELKVQGHLTPRLAGEIARKADVKRLVITHLYPVCEDYDLLAEIRAAGYKAPAEIARDGMRLRL